MNQLFLRLPVEQPKDVPKRKELRKATRCPQCHHICWQDDMFAGLCPDCTKEHQAEILDDQVG